jgi:hypothetical protein
MGFKTWFLYLGSYAVITMISLVGESSTSLIAADDVNNAAGFQVDKIGSGSGFLGTMRMVTEFFTDTLPKILFFNYGFLSGPLDIIQWMLILVFGGIGVVLLYVTFFGGIQRNV